jgi:hypothetical protein
MLAKLAGQRSFASSLVAHLQVYQRCYLVNEFSLPLTDDITELNRTGCAVLSSLVMDVESANIFC